MARSRRSTGGARTTPGHASASASPTVARSRRSREWISIPSVTASMPARSRSAGRLRRKARLIAEDFGLQPRTRSWRLHPPGRVPARLRERGWRAAVRSARPARPERDVHGLPGDRSVPRRVHALRQDRGEADRYAPEMNWPRRSSGAGRTARRWPGPPRSRISRTTAGGRTTSATRRMPTASAARSGRTSDVRTRATRCPGGGERTMRHRIIRRGMPYGPRRIGAASSRAWRSSASAPASRTASSSSSASGSTPATRSGLAASPTSCSNSRTRHGKPIGRIVIQGYRPVVLEPPEQPFVRVRGCEYLFVPSRSALRWMSEFTPPA